MTDQNQKGTFGDTLILAVIEAAVAVLTVLVFLAFGKFGYTVVTGAVLGWLVIMGNYVFLSVSVNRAVDNALAARGTRELSEEETEKFIEEQQAKITLAARSSFNIRILSMLAVLVIAFLTGVFDPIATVVPLLAFRPAITLCEFFRKKGSNGQP